MNLDTFVADCQRIIIERKEREAREQRDEALVQLLRPTDVVEPE